MKHLALVLPELRAGGAQRVMLMLARGFAEYGHHVDLVLAQAQGEFLSHVPASVRLVDLGVHRSWFGEPGFALHFMLRLVRYLRQEQPDATLSTLTGTNLVTILGCLLARSHTQLVIREACSLSNTRSRVRRVLMKVLYRWADRVVGLTPEIWNELREIVGLMPARLSVIRNPIDFEQICLAALAPCPHSWFGDDALPVVVTVGRLTAQKDHLTLIHAFARVVKQISARLIIIGEGPERQAIEDLVDTMGLRNSIELLGFDSNPWRWMVRADLFVLSSRWEGYPNVLIEARTLGVRIVSTEYDASVHELLGQRDAIVPIGDVEALTRAIVAALSCPRAEFRHQHSLEQNAVISYLAILLPMADTHTI